jgi:hypothetical protein
MKRRFREVIELLDYEELVRMKNDLVRGGDGIRMLVDNKIKEEIKKKNAFCAVCASKIEQDSSTRFELTFGQGEIERTVSFCAIDCLEYFLNELKKVKFK